MALFVTTIAPSTQDDVLPRPRVFGAQRRALVQLRWGSSTGGAESIPLNLTLAGNIKLKDICGIPNITRVEAARDVLNVAAATTPVAVDYWISPDYDLSSGTAVPTQEPVLYVNAGTAGVTYESYVWVYGF